MIFKLKVAPEAESITKNKCLGNMNEPINKEN